MRKKARWLLISTAPRSGGSVRFSVDMQNGKYGWGNIRLSPFALPPKSTGLSFEVLVEEADDSAVMHVWLFERDKDAWLARVNFADGKTLAEVKNTWRKATVPLASFKFDPRGAKNRNILSTEFMLFGFNYGNLTVRVRNLAFTGAEQALAVVKPSLPENWKHKDPVGRRIAIFADGSIEKLPSHADAQRLAQLLEKQGFHPQIMNAGDLAEQNCLSKAAIDLLILPNAPFFPIDAVQNFRKFLKNKGSFISIGGYPLDRPGAPSKGGWTTVDYPRRHDAAPAGSDRPLRSVVPPAADKLPPPCPATEMVYGRLADGRFRGRPRRRRHDRLQQPGLPQRPRTLYSSYPIT